MYLYVSQGWSTKTFRWNHPYEEIFEFLGKILLLSKSEILIVASIPKKVIEVVVSSGEVKGLSSSNDAPHDNSKRENISFHSIISFLL